LVTIFLGPLGFLTAMHQYTEDPLLNHYQRKQKRFGRQLNSRDRVFGFAVIIFLVFGGWWLVFHDSRSYTFTEAQVEKVFRPDTIEIGDGLTVYSKGGKAPETIILRTAESENGLSEALELVDQQMAIATEALAQEFPEEHIRGAKYEFHNLVLICASQQNCPYDTYVRRFLDEVQRLNLADTVDPEFVPGP
jgi:hypothetical protein